MSATRRKLLVDPLRAHGAWIQLFCAVGAGAFASGRGRVELAMLIGTAFAGAYLVGAALAHASRRRGRRLALGTGLALGGALLASRLDPHPSWLPVAALAAVPGVATVVLLRTRGLVHPATLLFGTAAITMAAPTVALAGGQSAPRAALLFAALWPVFAWRSWLVARSLEAVPSWEPESLRARGLSEARLAAIWTLVVAAGMRVA